MKMKTANAILILLAFIPTNFCSATSLSGNSSQSGQSTFQKPQQNINKLDKKKRREGNWEFYWDETTKEVSSKGKFRNGKQIGTWKYYSQAGKLERVEKNKFLSKKIKTVQYYPNGKIEKKGMAKVVVDAEYINYFWVGDWKCYDEAGNFVKVEKYVNGELVE
jgi:antitoxin component YwqK of YwqJK toxin-antitoxin module